jgi:hypothetical protein
MHGGTWLAPIGHVHAGGRADLRVYGQTEVCWRFSHVHGLFRKTLISVYLGSVAPHVTRESVAWLELAPRFRQRGCVAHVPHSLVAPVERHPRRFFVGIGDIAYLPAIGGQL